MILPNSGVAKKNWWLLNYTMEMFVPVCARVIYVSIYKFLFREAGKQVIEYVKVSLPGTTAHDTGFLQHIVLY